MANVSSLTVCNGKDKGKKFVIKTEKKKKDDHCTKQIFYPSSAVHIPVKINRQKRYRFRDSTDNNIFCSFKGDNEENEEKVQKKNVTKHLRSKEELYNDINNGNLLNENWFMQERWDSLKNSSNSGSKKTMSTAVSLNKKKNGSIDDARFYMNDKTKKCVRAVNCDIFGDKTKEVNGYAGN